MGASRTGEVINSGTIRAAGGKVLMTARAAADVAGGVINNTGMVEAVSVREQNGEIILDAGDGGAESSGSLVASGRGAGETGGTVKVLGREVALADGATIGVSGNAGGGNAIIGGNFLGRGSERNAQNTSIARRHGGVEMVMSEK